MKSLLFTLGLLLSLVSLSYAESTDDQALFDQYQSVNIYHLAPGITSYQSSNGTRTTVYEQSETSRTFHSVDRNGQVSSGTIYAPPIVRPAPTFPPDNASALEMLNSLWENEHRR